MSEHTLTPELEEYLYQVTGVLGPSRTYLRDLFVRGERAAAERARLGHVREFLGSDEFQDALFRGVAAFNRDPLGRGVAARVRDAWLARHPEAAS